MPPSEALLDSALEDELDLEREVDTVLGTDAAVRRVHDMIRKHLADRGVAGILPVLHEGGRELDHGSGRERPSPRRLHAADL